MLSQETKAVFLKSFFPLEYLKAMNKDEIEQNQGMNNHFGGSNSPRVY